MKNIGSFFIVNFNILKIQNIAFAENKESKSRLYIIQLISCSNIPNSIHL